MKRRWMYPLVAGALLVVGFGAAPARAATPRPAPTLAPGTVSAADVGGPAGAGTLPLPSVPIAAASVSTAMTAGAVLPFGDAPNEGSLAGHFVAAPIVGMAATPSGGGYWLVGSDGGVFSFGDAHFSGSAGSIHLNAPIVGMAATPSGHGYWLAAADGGIFAFGDAAFFGSVGGLHLNGPIVGMAATPSGHGYRLAAADGGVFDFGDAGFYGSTGGLRLNSPIVGMATSADGRGYWLVASDGGIFAFGDAHFFGSTGGIRLNQPVVGMAATPLGDGYWLAATDGGIFAFGRAGFHGSAAGLALAQPVIGIACSRTGQGYWLFEGQRPPPPAQVFTPALVGALNARAGVVSASVLDLNTGSLYEYRPGQRGITASIVKVQILGTLLTHLEAAGRGLTASEQALATQMIEFSDNNAATALWNEVGGAPGVAAFDAEAGLTATTPAFAWGLTLTTADDQITLLRHLVQSNGLLSDAWRTYALGLMENVTPSQAWGISGGVPAGATVALKNGWLPTGSGWTVNSIGWVSGSGRDYLIAALTDGDPSMGYGISSINLVSSQAWAALDTAE